MNELNFVSGSISEEFRSCFGDERLDRRLVAVATSAAGQPSQSFPKLFDHESEVEGFYRLLRNPVVSWEKIFAGHRGSTLSRAKKFDEVLAIHDTTTFKFSSNAKRDGLGWIGKNHRGTCKDEGFFGHFTLVAALDQGIAVPLGISDIQPYRRMGKSPKKCKNPRDANRENERWFQSAQSVGAALGPEKVIHVMDREADDYQLFANIICGNGRFVIRARHDRKVKVGDTYQVISTVAQSFMQFCNRDAFLNARKGREFPKRPNDYVARGSRKCQLDISAGHVCIRRPNLQPLELPRTLEINVVHVIESNPPDGETPIKWVLFSTEPIDSEEQVLKIIDIYRRRWLIEEYFKAIKTGCAYEQRQLESYKTLLNALAILIPIAWNLLLMRSLSRVATNVEAKTFFSKTQFIILQKKYQMKENADLAGALKVLARMGGHLSQNGPPGWITIGKGYQDLLMIELGVMLARDM